MKKLKHYLPFSPHPAPGGLWTICGKQWTTKMQTTHDITRVTCGACRLAIIKGA